MIRDYGEDVGSEETRSIESEDLAKDDVSDLFDETEESPGCQGTQEISRITRVVFHIL